MASIVLASGGTGGHIFPAVALGKKLTALGQQVFMFTDSRFDEYTSSRTDIEIFKLPLLRRAQGIRGQISFFSSLLRSYFIARKRLKILQTKVVVGFGGYVSLPTLWAAKHLGIPFILHEQNSVLGRVNRLFSSSAQIIATCFESTEHLPATNNKVIITGNPIEPEFNKIDKKIDMLDNLNIFVTGGSQGAEIFDKIVPKAFAEIPKDILEKISLVQQCKPENVNSITQNYLNLGLKAKVQTFFVDMAEEIGKSNLIISRAGATSIAEITAACRPAIYVPYPYATDNHQFLNAQHMKDQGVAMLLEEKDLSPESLKNLLIALFIDRAKLITMNRNARKLAKNQAVDKLADCILKIVDK